MRKNILYFCLAACIFIFISAKGQITKTSVNTIPEISSVDSVSDFFYTVRIGYFNQKKTRAELFNITDLYYYKSPKGGWVYIAGIFKSQEKASIACGEIIDKGVKDAYISVIKRGSEENVSYNQDYSLISFRLDSLTKLINSNKINYQNLIDSFKLSADFINAVNSEQFVESKSSKQSTLIYWLIIGLLVIIILAIFLIINLRKKFQSNSELMELKLKNDRQSMHEEIEKSVNELSVENAETRKMIMLNQLVSSLPLGNLDSGQNEPESLKLQKQMNSNSSNSHHLHSLKLADRIFNMKMRLDELPEKTPGKPDLEGIAKRVEEQFHKSNYTITDVLGKEFINESEFIVYSKIPNRANGEKLYVSKVRQPQVNFKGEIIQKAIVDLSKVKH